MIKVIWVSLPEFENQEYKKALTTLGYQVYGNLEILRTDGHVDKWNKELMGKDEIDYRKIFNGYDAIIQSPPTMFYKKVLKAHPDAKVVMEVVDSGIWYKRLMRVKRFFWWLGWLRIFKMTGKYLIMMDKMFYRLFQNDISPVNAQVKYRTFVNQVKLDIPKDRLLIISPEEGWQPLCQFLNKSIPNTKFPFQVNHRELQQTATNVVFSVLRKNSFWLVIYFGTLIGLAIYLLFFYS